MVMDSQWRRQDLLPGEGQSWKLGHGALTADFRARRSSGLMTISFVNNNRKSCELNC